MSRELTQIFSARILFLDNCLFSDQGKTFVDANLLLCLIMRILAEQAITNSIELSGRAFQMIISEVICGVE